MRRLYFIIPLLALTAFAGYYAYWDSTTGPDGVCKCPRSSPWHPCRHSDGARDAEAALRHGAYAFLTYGLPDDEPSDFDAVLHDDYDVVTRRVAGCIVDDDMVRYVAAYNAVMRHNLEQRFGPDIFKTIETKASARYAARHVSATPP